MVVEDETVDVNAIAARLSQMGENRALDYFWLMMREGAKPIMILGWMSKVVLDRPSTWSRATVRSQHEAGSSRLGPVADKRACYACQNGDCNLYFHHIIEVQNGGSNNLRNLVPLCFSCHKTLHPWLTVETKPRRGGGFRELRTVAGNMLDRMKARK